MPIEYDVNTDRLYMEGFKRGIALAREQIAVNCLYKGESYEETAEITGLTIERVEVIDEKRRVIEQVAIRCLDRGKSYEETAETTGLTIEQVAAIDKKRKN